MRRRHSWYSPVVLATLALPLAPVGAQAATPTTTAPVPTSAAAHELGQSYLFLRIHDDSLVYRLEITVADVERALGFGWDVDDVTLEQVEERLDSIRAYVEPRFSMSSRGTELDHAFEGVDVRFLEIADYVVLTYRVDDFAEIPDAVDIRYEVLFEVARSHRNLVVIEHNWRTATFNNEAIVSLILSPLDAEQTLDLSSSSILRGFIGFIWLGVWHIWIGIDHILFLVALVLPAVLQRREGRWEPVDSFRRALWNIVTIVTFFTIAHSVTLSLAALDVIRLPSRFVESIIAGSIAAAAWANLVPKLDIREWAIAFCFGLFHGFGFATVLGEIGMGREHLVLSLLGFNLGVELGQIAIICAIFPVLFVLRGSRVYPWILKSGSVFLIFVGLLWLFERTFEFNVPLVPIVRGVLGWIVGIVPGL